MNSPCEYVTLAGDRVLRERATMMETIRMPQLNVADQAVLVDSAVFTRLLNLGLRSVVVRDNTVFVETSTGLHTQLPCIQDPHHRLDQPHAEQLELKKAKSFLSTAQSLASVCGEDSLIYHQRGWLFCVSQDIKFMVCARMNHSRLPNACVRSADIQEMNAWLSNHHAVTAKMGHGRFALFTEREESSLALDLLDEEVPTSLVRLVERAQQSSLSLFCVKMPLWHCKARQICDRADPTDLVTISLCDDRFTMRLGEQEVEFLADQPLIQTQFSVTASALAATMRLEGETLEVGKISGDTRPLVSFHSNQTSVLAGIYIDNASALQTVDGVIEEYVDARFLGSVFCPREVVDTVNGMLSSQSMLARETKDFAWFMSQERHPLSFQHICALKNLDSELFIAQLKRSIKDE